MEDWQCAEVDERLALCEAGGLLDVEIKRLEILGEDPKTNCEFYTTAGVVLEQRSATNSDAKGQIKILMQLSEAEGCQIEEPEAKTPNVNIPLFCGGLG